MNYAHMMLDPWERTRKNRLQRLSMLKRSKRFLLDAHLMHAAPDLLQAAKNALADLEGIMPEFEPSGDREHPAWQTINELQRAIASATNQFVAFEVVVWKYDDGEKVDWTFASDGEQVSVLDEEADGFSVYATIKDGSSVLMETFDVDYEAEELPAETETDWQKRIIKEARAAAQELVDSLTKTYIKAI